MNRQPSEKWLNASIISVLLIIVVSIVFTLRSYRDITDFAVKSGQDQLTQANNYFIKVLQLQIRNYSLSLEDYHENMELTQEPLVWQADGGMNRVFDNNQGILGDLFLLDQNQQATQYQFSDGHFKKVTNQTVYLKKDLSLNKALSGTPPQNGKDYFVGQAAYINLYQTITDEAGKRLGLLVVPLNLTELFNKQLYSSDSDYNGYPMVKNTAMQVLMHPSAEQISLDIVEGRKEKYPELDFSDLEYLEEYQQEHKKGVLKYNSYWWTTDKPTEVTKINAFRWITVGDAHWVVASNSDFNEHNGVMLRELELIVALFGILATVILLITLVLNNYKKQNRQYLHFQKLAQQKKFDEEKAALEKQLLQESKMESIGLLTTSIVHDMNNFLTPLIGNLELLLDEYAEDEVLTEELQEVHEAALKGQQLSSNVLRFSKTDAGSKQLQKLADVVDGAVCTMQILIPHQIKLIFQRATEKTLLVDKDDVEVILYNLITNAYQAVAKNGQITVRVAEADQAQTMAFRQHSFAYQKKDFICIQVSDNGPGIPAEIQTDVFSSFFTTKKADGGTGLGLFTVASICKKNDWLLELTSNEQGTTFTIGIPID